MRHSYIIILRGYPASGKSTIGKALEKSGAGVFIDHNSILSYIASFTGDDEGIYSEIHQLEQAMASKILADGKNVIVARGFSTEKQVTPYLNIAKQKNSIAHIVALEVERELLEKRVVSPERKQGFNPSINVEAMSDWIEKNPRQSIEGEHIVINANKSVEEVTSEVLSLISS